VILTLRIECVRGAYLEEECVRIIEIDSDSSLLDLHSVIQQAVGFDRDHLFEFFAGRHERSRKLSFGHASDFDEDAGELADTTLAEVFPLDKHQKLYYHFDFGDDWYFEIRKARTKPRDPEAGVVYPRVVKAVGANPAQYGQ
jgi:hypothetical protein